MKREIQPEVLESLNEDYMKNVIPLLFNRLSVAPFYSFLSGKGPGTYDLQLDIDSIFRCAPEYKPITNRFVHFTSLRALNSILSEQGLRLYSLHNVDDSKEYRVIADEFGVTDFQIDLRKSGVYICSFCQANVLESAEVLWYWGKFGSERMGCAIEFELEDPVQSISHIKLANVLYSKPDFLAFLLANSEFETRHNVKTDLNNLIHLQACLHKNACYKIENEVRLFYEDGFAELDRACEEKYEYGFDFKSDKIVSYYKVKLYNKPIGYPSIKIKRVQFGPEIKVRELKKYEDHFSMLFISMMKRLGLKDDLPVFEISPLVTSFQ